MVKLCVLIQVTDLPPNTKACLDNKLCSEWITNHKIQAVILCLKMNTLSTEISKREGREER